MEKIKVCVCAEGLSKEEASQIKGMVEKKIAAIEKEREESIYYNLISSYAKQITDLIAKAKEQGIIFGTTLDGEGGYVGVDEKGKLIITHEHFLPSYYRYDVARSIRRSGKEYIRLAD